VQLDVSSIKAFVLKYFSTNASDWAVTLLSSARVGGGVLLSMAAAMLLLPVVLFYFLMDWPRIVRHFTALVPPRYSAAVDAFVLECDHMLGQYLRGQLLVMLLLACFYSAGLALFGFQLALPVGIFTGLAVFVPYVGFGLGLVLAILAAALQFGSVYGFVGVAVVYGLGQIVEGFFLTPRLVGERIGLHPVVVIFALLAFGHLFGFVGVLVALPVCAVLVVAFRRLQVFYFASPLYRA
jgi:predicted PurR-regulated permease PerM